MVDRWDASLGNSDAVWDTMEELARFGGFPDGMETFADLQRVWGKWVAVAKSALSVGDDVLVGRIFLMAHLFALTVAPKITQENIGDTGLDDPSPEHRRTLGATAFDALAKLDPGFLIHDTATGQVNVAFARNLAAEWSQSS